MTTAGTINRWSRYAVEAYTNPQEFDSPQDYLAALSECLDNLCSAYGQRPPNLSEASFGGKRK